MKPSRANHRRFISGLMMESEMKIFEMMNKKAGMSKYWMPLVWATNIINRARKEALITSDHVVQTLLVELSDIRKRLGALIGYDTVCVPLVYTQVSYSRGNDEFMSDRCTVYFFGIRTIPVFRGSRFSKHPRVVLGIHMQG